MDISSEIFQIGGNGFTSPDDAAVYLICFDGHAAVVDSGCGNSVSRLLKNIRSKGVKPEQVEYLLITHCHFDHTGGVNELRSQLKQCRVAAHELDASFLETGDSVVTAATWYGSRMEPVAVDIKLKGDRENIMLGDRVIEAIHIPGHSPGSVVYLTESEEMKVVFAQDVHGPLASSLLSNKKDYQQSLRLLLSLDADILCEGHYGVYKGKDEIRRFIQSFMD